MGGYASIFNSTPNLLTNPWMDIGKVPATTPNLVAEPWAEWGKSVGGQATAKPAQVNPSTTAKTLGTLTAIFGGINAAVGQFYAAKTQQYEMQSQASSLQFQSAMDAINAHGAEMNAQSILEQGKTQVQQYTMRAGQEQAASTVATAARGIDLSSQSAVDQRASNDLVKQVDVLTINANATRAAWAQRTQATNDRNASLLTGVSANNMLASADSVSPGSAFATSLLGSASSFASQWDWRRSFAGQAVG